MREVRVDLVRMSLRKPCGEGKSKKEEQNERVEAAVTEKKTNLGRKRKAGKDAAGDMRHQEEMLDQAEKKARMEVLAMLGLSEQVADEDREVVKKENLSCQQQKPSERGRKPCKVEEDVEENLLMEMQDIFNDLHDLS